MHLYSVSEIKSLVDSGELGWAKNIIIAMEEKRPQSSMLLAIDIIKKALYFRSRDTKYTYIEDFRFLTEYLAKLESAIKYGDPSRPDFFNHESEVIFHSENFFFKLKNYTSHLYADYSILLMNKLDVYTNRLARVFHHTFEDQEILREDIEGFHKLYVSRISTPF
jgi:hypothetical protein